MLRGLTLFLFLGLARRGVELEGGTLGACEDDAAGVLAGGLLRGLERLDMVKNFDVDEK